ncbi:DinB family protein [Galbibacter sp.]|uniref:DinB family protein n=1 Tax=Galbibacter sp. TaxID=2918471 RepID=UPI003A903EA5
MEGSEGMRIRSLFEDLFDGNPWLDVTIVANLCKIDAEMASSRPLKNCNTIWEIVNHMISWRENVLRRVNGDELVSPENNYFQEVEDTSEDAWVKTVKVLGQSQQDWMSYLENVKEEDLAKQYRPNMMDYYKHIHGILQHDAYHLGQIVLLLKFV